MFWPPRLQDAPGWRCSASPPASRILRALARTLLDLRLERVPTDRLRETGRTGHDLAVLLEAYEAELENRRFADYALRVDFAIDEVRTMEPAALLLISVQARTAIEKELLEVLVERAAATLLIPAIHTSAAQENCLTLSRSMRSQANPRPQGHRMIPSGLCRFQ